NSLISDTWSAANLQSALVDNRKDLSVVASHANHTTFLAPDNGFTTGLSGSTIISSSTNLGGAVVLTIGCHSGLNVPDVDSGSTAATLDLASAFAAKGAVYLANTGFGYGDTDAIAL